MTCAAAPIRAYTLLSSSEDGIVSALGARADLLAAAAWRHSLLLLLRTGAGSPLAGPWGSCQARLEVTQWLAHPSGPQAQGALVVDGRLLRVSPAGRRNAALHLWGLHPRPELLAAVEGTEYSLAYLTVTSAYWELPGRRVPLVPAVLVTCERDNALAGSLEACEHLNSCHRDIAHTLASRPAYFAELDSAGVTLGIEGGEFVHVAWSSPCETLEQVFVQLRAVCPGPVVPSIS